MGTVTLYDGRQVDSASEDWRRETEIRTILAMPMPKREEFMQGVERQRGEQAMRALKARCYELEPHYVLGLPNKPQRNAYLDQVERRFGPNAKDTLRFKVLELHKARHAVATETTESA